MLHDSTFMTLPIHKMCYCDFNSPVKPPIQRRVLGWWPSDINANGVVIDGSLTTGSEGNLAGSASNSYEFPSESSHYEEYEKEKEQLSEIECKTVTVKVTVRPLAGVSSSNSLFCQYVFCDKIKGSAADKLNFCHSHRLHKILYNSCQ